MPNALYLHVSALPYLPPILRVYEGCARAYIGAVDGANIIKLHREKAQISYLSYPDFDKDPHPALAVSMVVPLQTFQIQYRDYRDSHNPPILHQKEEFIPTDHPSYQKFTKLTRQEEKWGLYEDTATSWYKRGVGESFGGAGRSFFRVGLCTNHMHKNTAKGNIEKFLELLGSPSDLSKMVVTPQ